MITFRDLKDGIAGRESGLNVEGSDFALYANSAVRQLMNRGDFWSNVAVVDACVMINGALVWPRGVAALLAVNVNGHPTDMANRWYRFRPMEEEHYRWGLNWQHRGRGYKGNLVTETQGVSPVFNQILQPGFTIRTFISDVSDVGKFITYYGIDSNGQVAREQKSDGTWQDGFTRALAKPFVEHPQMQRVTRVRKDATNNYLNAYQYNVAQGFMLDLAQFQPSEKNPEYIVSRITGWNSHASTVAGFSNGCCPKQVTALVKLKFIEFVYDNDLVQIDNQDALRDMIKSCRKKGAGDIQGAAEYESSAIHELNRENETKMPDEQFIAMNRTFGGALPHRRIY